MASRWKHIESALGVLFLLSFKAVEMVFIRSRSKIIVLSPNSGIVNKDN